VVAVLLRRNRQIQHSFPHSLPHLLLLSSTRLYPRDEVLGFPIVETIELYPFYKILIRLTSATSSIRHGHDVTKAGEKAMKSEREDIIELGVVTFETKGGPVGKEDQERTFIPAFGLTND
jgi:hypothetical protein